MKFIESVQSRKYNRFKFECEFEYKCKRKFECECEFESKNQRRYWNKKHTNRAKLSTNNANNHEIAHRKIHRDENEKNSIVSRF